MMTTQMVSITSFGLRYKKIKKTLDKSQDLWYNKGVKRGAHKRYKKFLLVADKNFENPLDKSPSLWYNKDVNEGSKAEAEWQAPREASKTLTIKSSTARGVGVRNTNVNQTVQAETMSRISLLPQANEVLAKYLLGKI